MIGNMHTDMKIFRKSLMKCVRTFGIKIGRNEGCIAVFIRM